MGKKLTFAAVKKLAVILSFLLLCNCAINLWGHNCTCPVIAGIQEYSYAHDVNISESQPAGKSNISTNLYTASVQGSRSHSQTGKGGVPSNSFQCKTSSVHQTRYMHTACRKSALIIHSARSADRYVLELKKIII